MVGWHHRPDGHGFGWTPGVGDGQGGLACRSPWGRKESDTTERLSPAQRTAGPSVIEKVHQPLARRNGAKGSLLCCCMTRANTRSPRGGISGWRVGCGVEGVRPGAWTMVTVYSVLSI